MKSKKKIGREKGMKQKKGIIDVFDLFFEKELFNDIVEIGTGSGNFSVYTSKKASEMGASFTTFDVKDVKPFIKNQLNKFGGIFYNEDINQNTIIEDILKSDKRVLILNDGALKLPQFKRFAPLLKKNDCLMSHDYYKSDNDKSKGRITFGEVHEYIDKYNLKICYEKLLETFLWLCCIKE